MCWLVLLGWCAEFLSSLFLFLLKSNLLQLLKLFLRFFHFLHADLRLWLFTGEWINQNSEEQVEKNEIPNEDPRHVVDGRKGLDDVGATSWSHRYEHNLLPILHSKNLESCHKCDAEVFEVTSRDSLIRAKVIFTLVDLNAKQGIDEYEDEK